MANTISTRAAALGALAFGLAACTTTAPITATPPRPMTLVAPLDRMEVTSPFGERRGRPHEGIDLRARADTPVGSAGAGFVRFAGWQRGFGRLVIIAHGAEGAAGAALETWYAHLSGAVVDVGDRVEAGTLIGFVGSTGNATGPHLHFEVHEGGQPTDPLRWFGPAK